MRLQNPCPASSSLSLSAGALDFSVALPPTSAEDKSLLSSFELPLSLIQSPIALNNPRAFAFFLGLVFASGSSVLEVVSLSILAEVSLLAISRKI